MRFGRRRNPFERLGNVERLVGTTRNRLAAFTLLLVIALVSAAGLVTAAAAVRAMEESVDRTLRESAAAVMEGLVPPDSEEPAASAGPSSSPGEESDDEGSDRSPAPSVRATPRRLVTPAPTVAARPTPPGRPTETPQERRDRHDREEASPTANGPERTESPDVVGDAARAGAIAIGAAAAPSASPPGASPNPARSVLPEALEPDEHVPSSADTFFLILDTHGGLIANPQNVALRGLPDLAAVDAARLNGGEDLRTASVDGTPIRLLTQPIEGSDHVITGYLQSAIVLSLLRAQEADLWQTVLIVTLVGCLGATAVTLLVTHRALTPIRRAFATERRFVAAASHELRTPIAVIRASAEILSRERLVSSQGERFVDDVISEADRLGRQVADLLALSSLHAGAISIRPLPIELKPFLHEVAGRAATMAAIHAVTIAVDIGTVGPVISEVDPDRLEQLLMILIDNAVDHSPTNGVVRLVLTGKPGARDKVTISVVDQGPGVPPRERKRVFEPFAKVVHQRRRGESTGLGLAIARALADRLNAAITIGDAPGGGAVFSVTLRASLPSVRAVAERPQRGDGKDS